MIQEKNAADITVLKDEFLGNTPRAVTSNSVFDYYCCLYAWAFHQYIKAEQWEVVKILKHQFDEARYSLVRTDYNKEETVLVDGHLLLRKGELKLFVTLCLLSYTSSSQSFQVESSVENDPPARAFIEGIIKYAKEHNFYRGKKIDFGFPPDFLDLGNISWDNIILDKDVKQEIKANSIDFFKNKEVWSKYKIPLKRGILLSGAPGTGKTLICKALMAEAEGITCVNVKSGYLEMVNIEQVYEMAEDLRPSIIFVEDVDLIGKTREEFNTHESSLVNLLNTMDGIEEVDEIVTVATTNHVEMLDTALKERPSRFDRVVELQLPDAERRKELLELLCQRIPLTQDVKTFIAEKTEGFTPAQIQEVLYGLVIENPGIVKDTGNSELSFSKTHVDSVISRINRKVKRQAGFNTPSSANNINNQNKRGHCGQ